MKILIAGIATTPNQFTRAIDSYEGCTWVHQNGDEGARIPTDCDAAILVTCHMSHGKFYETKAAFKKMDKPFWMVDRSFSELVERFENFLLERGHVVVRRPQSNGANTTMGSAFKQALEKGKEQPAITEEKVTIQETCPSQDEAFEIMMRLEKDEGITKAKDIVKYFEANKIKTPTGMPYDAGRVYSTLSYCRKKLGIAPPNLHKSHGRNRADGNLPAITSTPKNISTQKQIELIGKVMASKLPPERKSELVEEILAGVRTIEHQVIAERKGDSLQITMQSIFEEGDKPLVLLDKITAIAIVKVLSEIRDFISE